MADIEDALGGLKSYFNQNDLNDPRVNSALRQRIAIQMMSGKKGYPKTVGEGLTAIGDELGDIGMANRLARADVAAQDAGAKIYDRAQQPAAPPVQPAPQATSDATGAVPAAPPVAAAADAAPPTAPPAPVQTASASPTGAASIGPNVADATSANSLVNPQVDPQRAAVTAALLRQTALGVPQPNPTLPGADVPPTSSPVPMPSAPAIGGRQQPDMRLASATPTTVTDIAPAPPMPRVQVAQATPPPARYDYVMPAPAAAAAPAKEPQSAEEQRLERMIIQNQGNPYAVQGLTRLLQDEQAKREFIDKQNTERFQNNLLQQRELEMKRQQQIQERAKAATEGQQSEATLAQTRLQTQQKGVFGALDPEQVYKEVAASRVLAQSAANGLKASADARAALPNAILGTGAGIRLDVAKLINGMGFADKGNAIANTETFRAAMQPIVAAILHQTSGTSQLSEGELRFAKDAAAGNITLDAKTIPRLLDIIDRRSQELLDRHDKMVGSLFGDNPQAKAVYGVERPFYRVDSEEEANKLPNGTRVYLNGRFGRVSK